MLLIKSKRNHAASSKGVCRILINVTVVGSAGPIRFVVNEDELVASVIETTLKLYAREGRLPVLGSKCNEFVLYCNVFGAEGLKAWEAIGSYGVRNFMLCKKPHSAVDDDVESDVKSVAASVARKSLCSWKTWFNKSLNSKVSSH
ncbi:hypothetical protein QVD17_21053 [Tagetes erecta]|uniref:DUF7054 domain-containing protein n=1 Tax=Tagetes erecta TaxID=13708 RepID=A0AAD8KMU0_TARER|nr:hypothetical protein QVD17_21053 [Tagetes erecta]